ncbi:hypothetical protein ACEN2I_05380 [Flavobacterium sp. W22_SRS_FK3]|uniref:hypothetical protein n=1 Tax=Flavobacterium sp. W22_SRS_FK3 TaxID=3240275 RepID=UPI003F931071
MFSQQNDDLETKEKLNPVIYLEGFGGPAIVQNVGIVGGVEINYQYQKSLFSFRFTNAVGYTKQEDFIIFPTYRKSEDFKEYSFLYGRRWLYTNHSYSISAGISYNNLELSVIIDEEGNHYEHTKYLYGVPFEANYKWFYRKKKSNLIYNILIPSVGVKFFGNIGECSYVGAGVCVGFGLSKNYK